MYLIGSTKSTRDFLYQLSPNKIPGNQQNLYKINSEIVSIGIPYSMQIDFSDINAVIICSAEDNATNRRAINLIKDVPDNVILEFSGNGFEENSLKVVNDLVEEIDKQSEQMQKSSSPRKSLSTGRLFELPSNPESSKAQTKHDSIELIAVCASQIRNSN